MINKDIQKADLREHIPLKQGLRRFLFLRRRLYHIMLREHIPLKQGLRQGFYQPYPLKR